MSLSPSAVFSPRTVFIMLLVGVCAFVGLGVLGAYAPELRARGQGGANALSHSAVGYAGLVRLLRDVGVATEVSRARLAPPVGAPGLLILTPPPGLSVANLAPAKSPRRRVLIVLPKWAYAPDPQRPGWVSGVAPFPALKDDKLLDSLGIHAIRQRAGAASVTLHGVAGAFGGLAPTPIGRIEHMQTLDLAGAQALVSDDQGFAVLAQVDPGTFVLADPDLLDNHGLAGLDRARVAFHLIDVLRGGPGPVFLDVTLNGLGRARSLLGLALQPPFLDASLCALAAALLMGVHAAARFGPTRLQAPPMALGKSALLDNSAMLLRLAGREPRMGRRYAMLIRRNLARRVLTVGRAELAPEIEAARLDAALDRLTPPGRPAFSTLATETERAADTTSLLRAARALHQTSVEILGERR